MDIDDLNSVGLDDNTSTGGTDGTDGEDTGNDVNTDGADNQSGADGADTGSDGTEGGTDGTGGADNNDGDAAQSNDSEGDSGDDSGTDGGDAGEGSENLSGIEQYLSQYGIDAGMIQFDDNTEKHFDELDTTKQVEILTQLHSQQSQDVEKRYGLDENEIGVINYLRENKLSFEEAVDNIANQRVASMIASRGADEIDYTKMSDDETYSMFLKQSNPEATEEQLLADLEAAKGMSNYTKINEQIRNQFISNQKSQQQEQALQRKKEQDAELEGQRKQIVETVSPLTEVDGIELNDGLKNSVLDKILSVDDDGDSKFLTEVFSDPDKLFKAAMWYYNGADILKNSNEYWKKEKSAAYKRGMGKSQSSKQTFVKTDGDNKTTPQFDSGEKSLDDMYEI